MKCFGLIGKRLLSFTRCEAGIAYIEFALSITVLLIMFYGAIEVTRYILIVQKVEKTIDTMTDVLTQTTTPVVTSDLTKYLGAAPELMSPYTFTSNGLIILTDLSVDAGSPTPQVKWQVCGGGTLAKQSEVAPGAVYKSLPPGFTMGVGGQAEEVVIGEIFYQFTPILSQDIVSSAIIYRDAVFRPRFVSNLTASNNCP